MKSTLGNKLVNFFSAWLMKTDPPDRSYLCDFDRIRHEVRLGDVLLIEGRNRVSHIISQVTHSPWTHAALYIGRLYDITDPALRVQVKKNYKGPIDSQMVIESILGSGTIISPLSKYKDDHVRICRPLGLTHEDSQQVISFSLNRLGLKYSIRHIIDLFRFLVPYGFLPKRWRSSLFTQNAQKPTEDICSTMIGEAFHSVHFPVLPQIQYSKDRGAELVRLNPKLLTPSDFDYSPYFAIIKYPMFPSTIYPSYRKLPWNEEGLLSDGEKIYQPKPEKPSKKEPPSPPAKDDPPASDAIKKYNEID